ncbi:hypothetical protein Y032_0102g3431 [Ancylostoma ceylanicum]|nr:hypothetical protein Y032_0102g3431 [Ancylostoma ceylanicum]
MIVDFDLKVPQHLLVMLLSLRVCRTSSFSFAFRGWRQFHTWRRYKGRGRTAAAGVHFRLFKLLVLLSPATK